MPADRSLGEDLARGLVDLYAGLQTRLAEGIAQRLRSGLDRADWAQQKLDAVTQLRRWAENLVARLDSRVGEQVGQALVLAYIRGGAEAMREFADLQSTHAEWLDVARLDQVSDRLRRAIDLRRGQLSEQLADLRLALPGLDALQRLQFSLTSGLRGTHLRITRWAEDVYRSVVGQVAADPLLGIATRRRAAQVAWERLLERGVTGFVDRSGRRWELASYVEMSARTHVAQAAVEGHLDRLSVAGLDLVIVSNAPQECDRCRPWEGQVLARRGVEGRQTIEVQHATQDRMIRVDVRGTVDEAIRAGLMHPNCRHSLSAYLPGVTRAPRNTADPEGDAARQELRRLERQVRHWKRREAGALTPEAKAKAAAKVRDYQRQIREHVNATGLIRQRHREQIGTAR